MDDDSHWKALAATKSISLKKVSVTYLSPSSMWHVCGVSAQ